MRRGIIALTAAAAFVLSTGTLPAISSAAAAPAQVISPVLVKMEKAGRDLKSLQAGIAQQKVDRTLGVKENSVGTFFYKAAGAGNERVLLNYTEPFPETVSVIGDKVSIYQPKINQLFVTSRKASANKNRSLGFLGLAYSDAASQLRERYDITVLGDDPVEGRMATQIQLDPKSKSEGVQSLMIWVDHQTWLPAKYFVLEKGSKTTITLSAMKPNVPLSDDKFEIAVPKDAKVVKG
jgi:outer membrane lipoprotein-sorting protein